MWVGLTACSAGVTPGRRAESTDASRQPLFVPSRIPGRPLAVEWDPKRDAHVLTRLDPQTLRTRGRLDLGAQGVNLTAASPDGSRLLYGSGKQLLLVIDPARLRVVREIELHKRFVRDLAWVEDRVAIATTVWQGTTRFVRFDPTTGEILGVRRMEGEAFRFARIGKGVVVLTAGPGRDETNRPGPVTIAVAEFSGRVVSRRIDDVRGGFFDPEDPDEFATNVEPALAARGSLATVVGVDGTIVNVDLTDLQVTVEGRSDSFFSALGRWLAPPAEAKIANATSLRATWASPDSLVVAGYRTQGTLGPGRSLEYSNDPAGLTVIDPADWSARELDGEGTIATPTGDLVLVSQEYLPGQVQGESIGLRAYDRDGTLAWEAFDGKAVWEPVVHEGHVFLTFGWSKIRVHSVDLATGEVLGSNPIPLTVLPW